MGPQHFNFAPKFPNMRISSLKFGTVLLGKKFRLEQEKFFSDRLILKGGGPDPLPRRHCLLPLG